MMDLEAIYNGKIFLWKLQWKQVSTSSSNSGFHVFKEILYHAQVMQKTGQGKEDEEDYLSMLRSAREEDSKKFPWILTNLTSNQMEQKFLCILTNLTPNQMEQTQKTW